MAIGAAIGSAVIGAGGAILSASKQKKASNRAIESQEASVSQQREDFAPWRDAGKKALAQIQEGIQSGRFDMKNFDVTQDPGYQFRMNEGIRARDYSASARGKLLSGAQLKGIERYAQGLASQEYGNAYAREVDANARDYNRLADMTSMGQASAAGQAAATGRAADNTSAIQMQQGENAANMYGGIATSANTLAQNWLLHNQQKNQAPAPSAQSAQRTA
jgi:hypothetical protein